MYVHGVFQGLTYRVAPPAGTMLGEEKNGVRCFFDGWNEKQKWWGRG